VFAFTDYTWLWLSGLTMSVTMQLRLLGSGQWLYDETGSAATLGYLGVIQLIQLPVALFGGVLADAMDRKKLMVMTQGVALLTTGGLALISWQGELAPWHIYAVTGVTGIVNMLGNSARPAMVARVVPKSHIQAAVTMNTATFQVASIVAPLVFGYVYTGIGVTATFAIAAGFAAVSVINPFLIKASGSPEGGSRRITPKLFIEGWSTVLKHPILPGLYLLDIGVTVVSFYRTLFPIFADKFYNCAPPGGEDNCATTVGWLTSANSLGAVAGSFSVLFATRFQRKGLMVLWATLAYSLLLFAFGFNRDYVFGLVIVVGLGATDAVTMTMRQTVVQLTMPDHLLGRASAAHSVAAMGANNLGQMEVAFMSAAVGAGPTMVAGGVIATAVTIGIWYAVRGISRYRYVEPADDVTSPKHASAATGAAGVAPPVTAAGAGATPTPRQPGPRRRFRVLTGPGRQSGRPHGGRGAHSQNGTSASHDGGTRRRNRLTPRHE
jgi:MFS family permease